MRLRSLFYIPLLGACAVCLGLVQAATAQVNPGTPASGAVQVFAQSWDVETDGRVSTINQSVIPIGVFLPLARGLDARVSTSYVSLSRRTDTADADETVSGLTDVKLQLNWNGFMNRRLLLGVALNIPSGSANLTSQEQDVVFDFVAPDLSVRANRLGEGFNIGTTLSYVHTLSPATNLGFAGGLIARGPYNTTFPGVPVEIELAPGAEAALSGVLDHTRGNTQVQFGAGFTLHGVEQINSTDAFQLGPKLDVQATVAQVYSTGRGMVTFSIREEYRLPNSVREAGAVVVQSLNINSNYLTLAATNAYAVTPRIDLTANALARLIGANEQDVGNSTVLEAGLSATFAATSQVQFSLGGRYVSGTGTDYEGLDRAITGFEGMVRATLRF